MSSYRGATRCRETRVGSRKADRRKETSGLKRTFGQPHRPVPCPRPFLLGLARRLKCEWSGTRVALIDGERVRTRHPRPPGAEGPWLLYCDHGRFRSFPERATAESSLEFPEEWCDRCEHNAGLWQWLDATYDGRGPRCPEDDGRKCHCEPHPYCGARGCNGVRD